MHIIGGFPIQPIAKKQKIINGSGAQNLKHKYKRCERKGQTGMSKAIEVAVQWWTEQLQNRSIGTSGDSNIDMWFFLAMRGHVKDLDMQQVKVFQAS
jgi:hypothetical protein